MMYTNPNIFRHWRPSSVLGPKFIGVGSYYELCFMICNLLYFSKCISWLMYSV